MKNNEKDYFEVNCSLNYGERLVLKIPFTIHADFERTVDSGDESLMKRLVELFAEYELLDSAHRSAFQALIIAREKEMSTLDDLLECMKAIRLCSAFFENK